jgi:hypothetical protein
LRGHSGSVLGLAFAPNGQWLASASADGTIRLGDPMQGREINVLTGRFGAFRSVVFSPDGSLLALGGQDRIIRLHPLKPSAIAKVPAPPAPSMLPDASSPSKAVLPLPKVSNPTAMPQVEQGTPPVMALAAPFDGQQLTTDRISLLGAAASHKGIARVEIRVNSQLHTQRDAPSIAPQANLEFSERLLLREGANEIVVTAIDRERQVATRAVTVTQVAECGKIWAVVVGISRYKTVRSLHFGDKDARCVYDYLLNQVGIPQENITLLINE